MYLSISHIHHIPECCTARMLYYAMGVYVHAATLHPRSSCGLCITVGSHTPEISSSGYLTGHDPTHRDLMDPGSLDLEYLIIYISTGYTSPPTYMPMHAWPHTTYAVLYPRTCGVYHIPHPTLSLSPLPGSRDLGPLWISCISDPTSPDLVIPGS